ncbi:interleukin-17 receptor E [Notothenia coriiceps]|uniref:Interleukin-17 receptor E-like n=1 Tax=Notothenia coriiceps TaxID=8208 RepID=A0A6I9Q0X2_9TELE|nr:PREDICTED: interleukin-17 receptor E-like [Notothenia coriiceps]XP_010794221.1 PREDICTED: interleukin-17 receptor E-like [Notothenia coriiceps]
MDARRHKKCPFQNKSHTDARDVWLSSEVSLYESSLNWSSECPASDLNISASLCWRQNEKLCTPVLNSTLEDRKVGRNMIYNTSAVDKHPQMCLQLSLQGSQEIYCRFEAGMSSWEVHMGPGRQSVVLFITSLAPASFSAQLCVLNERECTPMGQVHSVTIEAYTTKTRIHVPLLFLAEKPCVQVWQSHPALLGRRILCPDYSSDRCGMYAVAALVSVVIVALLGMFIHRLNKSGAAGWLCIREPVLLVCSSEQSAHVSAVCALASILQGELSASVHMALWAQSSQTKNGTEPGTGVADLGPLPWLYGQWEAMREAQGKVLIIWSPEATETHEKWREERANMQRSKRNMREEEVSGGRLGKCKREKAAVKKECDDKDWYTQTEPSTVIAPVFAAALACLEGALQECKSQGVALVYFQGLCHSRDIPKAFRGVPRFCLPQDFRGFVQELGRMKRQKRTGKLRWNCLHRLLAKVQSVWLARQLAKRLETLLPQTQGKKTQGPSDTSSLIYNNF